MKQSTKYLKILMNLLVAALTIVFLCVIFPRLIAFFMPFVVGWIISMIANPLVRFLEKRLKIVRKHGSMMIIIAVLAVVILLGYLGVSKLVAETGNLIENLPQIYENWHKERMEAEGVTDLYNPYGNIRVGLNFLQELTGGGVNADYHYVLMSYNMGESRAKAFYEKGIYSTEYSTGILQRAQELQQELKE